MNTSTANLTLTPDQQKAADAFFDFLLKDDPIFVLSGGAGVGKTFLMRYLSNDLMFNYEQSCKLMDIPQLYRDIHYTATTNKAAEVLENAVGKEVSTIHSFLGLRVRDDYKTGKTILTETNGSNTYSNIILFIDESSMIDQALLNQILKRVTNSKIVFVGDKAQLAPVGDIISPVYTNVDPDNFIHLTQSVRNANSPALMNLCAQLRTTVETGEFFQIENVPGSIEYLDDDQMQKKLKEHFLQENDQARILCYTNSRVAAYNEYIRKIRGLPPEITTGDNLVVAQTYTKGKLVLNVEREVTVITVDSKIQSAGFEDFTPDGKEITYRNVVIASKFSGARFEVAVPTDMEQVKETIKKLGRKKMWAEYFQLKNKYADLRGKEACTVYKSQGSTYDTVFIDIGNIGTSRDAEQVARMLFVGASRATTKVYLYGQLPPKYTGRSYYAPQTSNQDVAAE